MQWSMAQFLPFLKCRLGRTTTVPEHDFKQNSSDVLKRYLPSSAQETLFGGTTGPMNGSAAVKVAATKRIPVIPLYLISTNPDNETGVRFLFKDMPVVIYRLKGDHFFAAEQGAYKGMGIDRLSAAKAAVSLTGTPTLVIDGGTAMTYTAVDVNGHIIGGGISPGLQVQLSSLGEYTGALPSLTHSDIEKAVAECKEKNEPLPLFARDTKRAILSSVMIQTAQHVVAIVQGWLKRAKPELEAVLATEESGSGSRKLNKDFNIVVTGGDGKFIEDLLKPEHSGIVPEIRDVPTGFKVLMQKHMVHLGVQKLLGDNLVELEKKTPNDQLRDEIIGQRVAKVFRAKGKGSPTTYRGTVAAITRGDTVGEDSYTIVYDDNDREDVGIVDLYGK